jgi:hypothetical protein
MIEHLDRGKCLALPQPPRLGWLSSDSSRPDAGFRELPTRLSPIPYPLLVNILTPCAPELGKAEGEETLTGDAGVHTPGSCSGGIEPGGTTGSQTGYEHRVPHPIVDEIVNPHAESRAAAVTKQG